MIFSLGTMAAQHPSLFHNQSSLIPIQQPQTSNLETEIRQLPTHLMTPLIMSNNPSNNLMQEMTHLTLVNTCQRRSYEQLLDEGRMNVEEVIG